jgi:hypothetical protein
MKTHLLFLLLITCLLVIGNVQCKPNYREALAKSLLFFQGQRSGRLPPDQQIKWRSNSGLSDGRLANVCNIFHFHFPFFFFHVLCWQCYIICLFLRFKVVCLLSGDKEVMSSNMWNTIFVCDCEGNLYPSQTTPGGNLVHLNGLFIFVLFVFRVMYLMKYILKTSL